MRAAPQRFILAILDGLIRQRITFSRRPGAQVPTVMQKLVMFASMAAQHDAQLFVVSIGKAPGAHVIRQRATHTTGCVVHCAFRIGRVKEHTSKAVSGVTLSLTTRPQSPHATRTLRKRSCSRPNHSRM